MTPYRTMFDLVASMPHLILDSLKEVQMPVQDIILKTKPAGPVEFSEKAIQKVFETTGWVIADTKEDGVQLNLVVRPSRIGGYKAVQVHMLSRAGKFLPALQNAYGADQHELAKAFIALLDDEYCIYPDGFMLQAEIVTPGKPAEVTAGNLRRHESLDLDQIEIHVFAVVPLDVIESGKDHQVTHGIMKFHAEAMTALLQKHLVTIDWKMVETIDCFSLQELQALYEIRRDAGKEGLVVKDPNAIWKRGKKVGQWKMKPNDKIDGTVQGLVWGTPGLANEGKVIGFEVLLEDGHVVNACGLTEDQKDEFILAYRDAAYAAGTSFVNPFDGWAVEVSFMERFKDGSLRHPTFNRWRGISSPEVKE